MTEKELSIFSGTHVWKSMLEYHNKWTFMRGYPYFQISRVDDVYYLWELVLDDPDNVTYRIMKKCDDFNPLFEEGMKLAEALGKKYDKLHLYYKEGKELVDKLRSLD